VRINVVFNVEGTTELMTVAQALNHVATVNEKVKLEEALEQLQKDVEDLLAEKIELQEEVVKLKVQVHPDEVKLKDSGVFCKESSDSSASVSSGQPCNNAVSRR
jgi:uncharacterized protein YlxW (UPF0749 family)